MTFLYGVIIGSMVGCIIGVIVMSMMVVAKGTDEIIVELCEVLIEWTELADNIHLPGKELYERSIRALNRAQRGLRG